MVTPTFGNFQFFFLVQISFCLPFFCSSLFSIFLIQLANSFFLSCFVLFVSLFPLLIFDFQIVYYCVFIIGLAIYNCFFLQICILFVNIKLLYLKLLYYILNEGNSLVSSMFWHTCLRILVFGDLQKYQDFLYSYIQLAKRKKNNTYKYTSGTILLKNECHPVDYVLRMGYHAPCRIWPF